MIVLVLFCVVYWDIAFQFIHGLRNTPDDPENQDIHTAPGGGQGVDELLAAMQQLVTTGQLAAACNHHATWALGHQLAIVVARVGWFRGELVQCR